MVKDTYDYIVCGGGTSGCVVAGRLAEDPDIKVLLIEAGDHSDNVPATQMAGGVFSMIRSEHDWGFVDERSPALGGRAVPLTRGKVLGGSSAINGTYAIRGTKADYDDWDLPGWSGEDVFEYMKKAETFVRQKTDDIAIDHHGAAGPIRTSIHPWLPIDRRIRDSYLAKGIEWKQDLFTTGAFPEGCSDVPVTVGDGFRSTSAAYVTGKNARRNLEVLSKTLVDRIALSRDQNGVLQADSVHVVLQDGTKTILHASQEIILSAGAYCSPMILLRSGVGSHEELSKHGIELALELPGVGRNLQDHVLVNVTYEVSEPGLTTDHLVWHEGAMQRSHEEWNEKKSGFMANFPYAALAWARLDERLDDSELWKTAERKAGRDPMGLDPARQPSVELVAGECWLQPAGLDITIPPFDGSSVMTMMALLFSAQSRGTVTLSSSDPLATPVINHNYLGNDLDTLVLAEGVRLANEIVTQGKATKDIIKGAWPRDRDFHSWSTREQWIDYVKKYSHSCYHPAGTCAMGKPDDRNAVLDDQLRVRGIRGLRVADVSIMPTLNSGHPQMPAYAIGEKAADLLKAARQEV